MRNNVFQKVFMFLAIGLFVSFVTAYLVSTNSTMVYNVFGKYFWLLVLIELGTAFILSLWLHKMSSMTAKILYIVYCIISGFSLSSIFILYKINSIVWVFLVTCLIFTGLSIYGYTTKKDITKLGPILMFGLIGIVLVSVINIFIQSSTVNMITSIVGVLIFTFFIAYDINMIKRLEGSMDDNKLAVFGAFQLYLDFINIIIDLLNLFGREK